MSRLMDPTLRIQTLTSMENEVNNVYGNSSLVSEYQGVCEGRSDSVVDTLPTEGYYIFDERPISIPPSPSVQETSAIPYMSLTSSSSGNTHSSRAIQALAAAGRFLTNYWNYIMSVFVPLGLAAPYIGCNDSAVFILNCFAIVPLANVLCHATESIASFMGETTGALANVTMGNLTELVMFIQALVHRQYIIVRTSLLGSIVVNILLVLGLAILVGEGRERGQIYNVIATRVAAGLFCLTTVSILIPSTLQVGPDDSLTAHKMTSLSRATSMVLFIVYLLYIWTQIRSAKYAYKPLIQLEDPDELASEVAVELGRPNLHHRNLSYPCVPLASPPLLSMIDSKSYDSFDNGAEDVTGSTGISPSINRIWMAVKLMAAAAWVKKTAATILLLVSTGLISICSENLVSRVDHLAAHSPISKTMVGLIILPIVGNAAELVSGIMFASRKQMDLAFAVSIGSAIQIALFVTPLIVLIGWAIDRDMSLHFTPFESVTLAASSVLFLMLVLDNRCSLLKGICLCAGYIVITLVSYFVTDAE